MLINLWSTPRTGSVWYSYHLKTQHPDSLLLTEIFNQYHMNMYHYRNEDGSIKNYHTFVDGSFYFEFFLDENNLLKKRKIFSERIRSSDEEEDYCFELIKKVNRSQILILHNHIDPIRNNIRDFLISKADRNIWIYRKNKVEQLASYAIAMSTKKFAIFRDNAITDEFIQDCDQKHLENLIRRIKIWDMFYKEETVAFEDINFYNQKGFPLDQNLDPLSKISDSLKSTIKLLVEKYENDKDKQP